MAKKPNTIPFPEMWKRFDDLMMFHLHDDLACAVVGATLLDYSMTNMLELFFIQGSTSQQMLAPNGLLSDFSSRARMLYVLGMIPDTLYASLNHVAQIRNKFAHQLDVTFADTEVQEWVKKLVLPSNRLSFFIPANSDEMLSTRTIYIRFVMMTLTALLLAGPEIERRVSKTAKEYPFWDLIEENHGVWKLPEPERKVPS
jgi:DNA-binding MltR family transcriptional regulator